MFYVAEAIYHDPLPCAPQELADTLMPAHAAHVRAGAEKGLVLLGGPKAEEPGGFLILRSDSREELDRFLNADPLVVHGVQHFRVTPWKVFDTAPELGALRIGN